jgi:hypothetical protein
MPQEERPPLHYQSVVRGISEFNGAKDIVYFGIMLRIPRDVFARREQNILLNMSNQLLPECTNYSPTLRIWNHFLMGYTSAMKSTILRQEMCSYNGASLAGRKSHAPPVAPSPPTPSRES